MKKLLSVSLILSGMSMLSQAFPIYAQSSEIPITLYKEWNTQSIREIDPDKINHRKPPRPIHSTISTSRIEIPSISSDDIISFDICYDSTGDLIASYTSEEDFISSIYNMSENVEIRIYVNDYVLRGWLKFK